MTVLAISVLSLLLAIVLRSGKFPQLRSLVLPLTVTALVGATRTITVFFVSDERMREWTAIALIAAIGFLIARACLLVLFDWGLQRRMGMNVPQLIRDVTSLIVYITLATIILNSLGYKLTGLIATSAVLTVVIGLAFQQTLGNLLAGLALAWEQHLPTGSWIDFNGQVARVEASGWRSILLRTKLGDRILVPNADVAAAQITLLSGGERPVAVAVRLGLAYSVPPDQAKVVLSQVAADMTEILDEPPPKILTMEYADSSIDYECRLWTRTPWQRNEIIDTFLTRAYAALARNGLEIPFPQVTLHRAPPKPPSDSIELRLRGLTDAKLFADLPLDALAPVAEACRLQRFAPGEAVVHQGDESNALFVIVSGEAVVRFNNREVSRVRPGEIFGEGAFLTGNPRAATVRAGRDALEVLEISKQILADLITNHPELTDKLAERLAERQLEGETVRDETGAMVHPHGLVSHLKRTLSRLVGGG